MCDENKREVSYEEAFVKLCEVLESCSKHTERIEGAFLVIADLFERDVKELTLEV